MTSPLAADLAARLLDLTALVTGPGPLDRARSEAAVLGLLRDHVPGVVSASVTRGPARRPVTTASSDALAERADRLQYDTGEGPCLQALTTGDDVLADLADDDGRWPAFRRRVRAEPSIGGVLSRPLRGGPAGSLNVYLGWPGPDREVVAVATAAAGLALAAVATRARSDQLAEAVATNRTIGAAVGVLMVRRRVGQDAAFTALREASQHANRKLRDVAADVLAGGDLPPGP